MDSYLEAVRTIKDVIGARLAPPFLLDDMGTRLDLVTDDEQRVILGDAFATMPASGHVRGPWINPGEWPVSAADHLDDEGWAVLFDDFKEWFGTSGVVVSIHAAGRILGNARAHQSLVDRATREDVTILTEAEITAIEGDHRVRQAVLRLADGSTRELPADSIVGALGLLSAPTPFPPGGWVRERKAVVDSRMQTSVPGVFAVGDASTSGGRVALVVAGFGEAATAVNNAAVHLEPELALMPGHSTDDDLAPPRTRTGSIPVVRASGGQA